MPDIHQRAGKSPAVPFSTETAGPAFVQKIARESKKLLHNEQELFQCWHRPIFPGRRQPSIFGTDELNYRVRNGNGWTLIVINTN
jgi:hypothetical protein